MCNYSLYATTIGIIKNEIIIMHLTNNFIDLNGLKQMPHMNEANFQNSFYHKHKNNSLAS